MDVVGLLVKSLHIVSVVLEQTRLLGPGPTKASRGPDRSRPQRREAWRQAIDVHPAPFHAHRRGRMTVLGQVFGSIASVLAELPLDEFESRDRGMRGGFTQPLCQRRPARNACLLQLEA